MKKIFLSIVFGLCFTAAFAAVNVELTLGIASNFTTINGKSSYSSKNSYGNLNRPCDYVADYNAICFFDNLDLFINKFPLGVHMASGIGFDSKLKRNVAGRSEQLNDTEFSYNSFFELGAVYAHPINKYFYICAAPSFAMLYAQSKHKEGFYSRYTLDDALCFGVSGDCYIKFKYKRFIGRAGCAASYYPAASVVSSDTQYNYSSIKETMAYNIRPYFSVGVVLGVLD